MTKLINLSEVKRNVTNSNIGKGFFEKLELELNKMIIKAEKRAEANGRKTVYERDL